MPREADEILVGQVGQVQWLRRQEGMPDLPTVAEQAFPGFESLAWNGLFAPAGLAPDLVRRINANANAALPVGGPDVAPDAG